MNIFKFLGLILVFALILSNSSLALADEGWDYMGSDLRVDLAEVNSARDYQVWINANGVANLGDPTSSFTTAWLGIYILPSPTFFRLV
ncbi:MAG TPA: hypothetical protein VF338_09260 [Leptolinea sp.]